MKKKNIIFKEIPTNHDEISLYEEEIYNKLHDINLRDKLIYNKAIKAFVSYIRFYTEIDLKYIFDVEKLDIGNLANSFKLLRLPRVKEIIGRKVENFNQSSINPESIVYLDKNYEKQMIEKKEKLKDIQEERKLKKEKAMLDALVKKQHRTKKEKKVSKMREVINDWDELADEERAYKKMFISMNTEGVTTGHKKGYSKQTTACLKPYFN